MQLNRIYRRLTRSPAASRPFPAVAECPPFGPFGLAKAETETQPTGNNSGVPAAGYGIFLQFFGRLLSNFVNSSTSSSGFNKSFCAAATIRCTFHALFASGSWAITIKWKLVHSTLEGSIECQHLPQGTSQIEKKKTVQIKLPANI